MVSPWKCILIVCVCTCWVHAAPDDNQVKRRSLQFNLCRAFNTEEFVCDKILGHFCTYCVNHDAPEGSANKSICETKANAKRANKDGYKCHKDSVPPPAPHTPSNTACQFANESTCDADSQCTWCRSAAVGAGCFAVDQAKRLPKSIFDCTKN